MEVLQYGLLIFLVYLCVYGIVNRVCRCFETCSKYKSTSVHTMDTINRLTKMED